MLSVDDVNALVLEVGTSQTRLGYAGEDLPRFCFGTALGQQTPANDAADSAEGKTRRFLCGQQATTTSALVENVDMMNPLAQGQVADWEAYQHLWQFAFQDQLRMDPTQMPLLFCEPSQQWTEHESMSSTAMAAAYREQREKITELAFEQFQCPAFFMANQAVLSAFAAGKSSALIVDVGAGVTSITPVHEGYALRKGILSSPLAGDFLSKQILLEFEQNLKIPVVPTYRVSRKKPVDVGQPADAVLRKIQNVRESFDLAAKMRVIDDYKEANCMVAESVYNEEVLNIRPQKAYEFPDGFNYSFGAERFRIPELLFDPQEHAIPSDTLGVDIGSLVGLPKLAWQSIEACDMDIRAPLLSNIVLTGGSTLFPNMTERFHREMMQLAPATRVKVYAAGTSMERRFGPWIGGSILASLGTFQQMWVSKQEYEEEGFNIMEKRCQ